MHKSFILVLILFFLALPSYSFGAQPQDVLKEAVNTIIDILENPDYQDSSQKENQHQKLWDIIKNIFDFTEMSMRTLATNWKSFSPDQQKEFIDVFGRFLGNNYLGKIQSDFKGEKVVFLDQEMLSDTRALIKTEIIRESSRIPVDYSMFDKNGTWQIYDVRIEGVSLVQNYRSQFANILLNKSPDILIEQLKQKLNENDTSK
ncbi:MAG: ABC transporter substrate-binding protein [Deltaproteobacteria bacterium]|nr:ABC transporter substrate-binding protein [Deltaproteobacteria bacterium]